MTTRYLASYVAADGSRYICKNSFAANDDGLTIIGYYSAPRIGAGGAFEGWRVEYAPCDFDVSKEPDAQTITAPWRALPTLWESSETLQSVKMCEALTALAAELPAHAPAIDAVRTTLPVASLARLFRIIRGA